MAIGCTMEAQRNLVPSFVPVGVAAEKAPEFGTPYKIGRPKGCKNMVSANVVSSGLPVQVE